MMRYVVAALLTASLLLPRGSHAQIQTHEEHLKTEADQYYQDEQFNLAIQYYRELSNLSDQSAEVNYQLAESYRKTFNYTEAETYYLKTFYQSPVEYPLALYYYSLMLKLNGSLDLSIDSFTEFIFTNQDNPDMKEQVEQAIVDRAGSDMAKTELFKSNAAYKLKPEQINSIFNDFAPASLDSTTLVITSGRFESNREAVDERFGEAFTDNFYFTKVGNAWRNNTRQMFNITNTRYNDGSGCFNGNGDKYYFTICGKDGPQCRIFLSRLKNNKWTEPIALNENINYRIFESKHPAVSKGGDTLLFSTNRIGGYGNFDLWMSVNSGDENWGPAINLGNTINTKLNEVSASFTSFSHIFFFASDGHQNYGGMDLYIAKRFSSGAIALYNLDIPFNSARDDCFINHVGKKLYFSSNREGGQGGFDIYSVAIPSLVSFISKLSLRNKDARSDIKLNARTEATNNVSLLAARNEDRIEYENLTYEKKKIVDRMVHNQIKGIANEAGHFEGLTEADYQLLMNISETQYKTYELEKRFTKTFLTRVSSAAYANKSVSVTGILKDSLTGIAITSRKILLMDESGEVLKITTTNELGKFRFTNIEMNSNLYLRMESLPSETAGNTIVDGLKLEETENQSSAYENIYFDFDHYVLRPEAKVILNELANFLITAPHAQVEIYAYADDVGEEGYNLVLTQKRGQAVLNYLTSKGVDQTGLAIIAQGRQRNPTTDIEIQRQFNRRVEFYVNGVKSTSDRTVNTYILKRKSDWTSISKATGINEQELKILNGAINNEIPIFQPVRIPLGAKEISEVLFFSIL